MADVAAFEMKTYEDIKAEYPFWNYAGTTLVDKLYRLGKKPQIVTFELTCDTLAAALAEWTKPANEVMNFAAPMQLYLRSDAAGDTSISCYIIGQKSTGEFGKFLITTDDTDGTTPIDLGLWNVVFFTETYEAAAGNLIIDDDGASTTIYYTLALGVGVADGMIYVPDGYLASTIDLHISITDVPTTVATDAVFANCGNCRTSVLPYGQVGGGGTITPIHSPIHEHDAVVISTRYDTAVIPCSIYGSVVFWEKPQ
jgi:hypothetical protein